MVKNSGILIFIITCFFVQPASADVVSKCITLMSATGQTASTNGTVTALPDLDPKRLDSKAFTVIAQATNNSGTTPTLDVTLQTCESYTTSTCSDTPAVFDQCTTGSCYGGDGIQRIDINQQSVNVFPFFRAKTTLTGTSPNYDVTVRLCYK